MAADLVRSERATGSDESGDVDERWRGADENKIGGRR